MKLVSQLWYALIMTSTILPPRHGDVDVVADFGLLPGMPMKISRGMVRSTLTCRLYASVPSCQHHPP